jgi:hypothetical protein
VPPEAHDELRRDAIFRLSLLHAGREAIDGDREGKPAVGMGLGIKEDLGVAAAIGVEPGEIGERDVLEVLFRHQDVVGLIDDVEEILQVGEGVGGLDLLDGLERDIDLVALAEREHLLGLERAFDVQVELGLGQTADEAREIRHANEPIPGHPVGILEWAVMRDPFGNEFCVIRWPLDS